MYLLSVKLLTTTFILSLCSFSNETIQDSTTYDKVISGKRSLKNSQGEIEYEYRVGQSLHFAIIAPNKVDGSIYFYSSSFEDDYFAIVSISGDYIIVRPGMKANSNNKMDIAFVSTKNGNVYRTLEDYNAENKIH